MKKISLFKKILVSVALAIGCLVLFIGIFFGPVLLAVSGMTPGQSGVVVPKVWRQADGTGSSYLVEAPEGLVLIDTGYSSAIIEKIKQNGKDPSSVKAIFLTHSDRDHTGGLEAFPGVPTYAYTDEGPFLDGTKKKVWWASGKVEVPVTLVQDGAEIEVAGVMVKVISTPGHTPGSASFLINDSLFTGDLIKISDRNLIPFDSALSMDTEQMSQSIEKLKKLTGVQWIHTSHYGSIKSAISMNP